MKRLIILALAIVCAGAAVPVAREELQGRGSGDLIEGRIVEAVDGDTVKVRASGGRRYSVRLIGIDTPETRRPGVGIECGGPQASAHMKQLVPPGTRVRLRTDPTQDTYDRYDRLLAYVTTRSGANLQARMLAAGWATTYVYDDTPFQRVERFRDAERRARSAGRGVHGMCGGDFHRAA